MSADPAQQAQNAASAMKTIVDLAADHPEFKQAGTNLAKSARTITALIDNCLLPIAAVNYAFEKGKTYFQEKFTSDLTEATSQIPPENLIEPKASIAAPILQGLTFAHDEPDLKSLFLSLLGSSMDGRVAERAHPAFVEVLRQITSEEARLLKGILSTDTVLPVAEIRVKVPDSSDYNVFERNVISTGDTETGRPIKIARMSVMIDNWSRLGIVFVTYSARVGGTNAYDWVEDRPEYKDAVSSFGKERIFFEKGGMSLTSFGREFALAVNQRAPKL